MPNPATVEDVEARWRPLSEAETVVCQSLLDDAWLIVKARVPDVEQRMLDEQLDPNLVVSVICAMVLRVLKNPEGKRQESIDDYSYLRDESNAAGMLYLTDDELGLLGGTGSPGAWTITPYGEPDTVSVDPWANVG